MQYAHLCTTPPNYRLKSHRLHAGDLALSFARQRDWLTLRQIALASLALSRKPLDQWLTDQLRVVEKHYTPGNLMETSLDTNGRDLTGYQRPSTRRTRFAWMRWLPRDVATLALHDPARDRIVIAQGSCESSVRAIAATAGDEG